MKCHSPVESECQRQRLASSRYSNEALPPTYLDRLPPQNEERLRSLRQESRELVHQNVLNLVRLLYPYADAHTVDRGLDEDSLFLVSRHGKRVEDQLGRGASFDLGDIVSFTSLRSEVGQ